MADKRAFSKQEGTDPAASSSSGDKGKTGQKSAEERNTFVYKSTQQHMKELLNEREQQLMKELLNEREQPFADKAAKEHAQLLERRKALLTDKDLQGSMTQQAWDQEVEYVNKRIGDMYQALVREYEKNPDEENG